MRSIKHSGQTLVIAGLCIVVLVACLGLVIDFGRSYIATQQLVGKVDAAALAGAPSLPTAATARTDATQCYNAQVPGGSVTTISAGTSPCNGVNVGDANTTFYSIDGDCVAITTPYSDTYTDAQGYSSSVLIKVRAYDEFTYMVGSIFGLGTKKLYASGTSMQKVPVVAMHVLALAPGSTNRPKAFYLRSGTVNVTGGVQVNSSHATALFTNGTLTASSDINVVGGYSGSVTPTPTPLTGQLSIADPFAALPPVSPVPALAPVWWAGFTLTSGSRTIDPGRYTGSITVNNGGTLNMNPGTYYFDNVDFLVNTGGVANGSGVFFYLNDNKAQFICSGTLNLSPPTSGTYDGVLIFQYQASTQPVEFRGTSLSGAVSGAVYARDGQFYTYLTAWGSISNTQIVADTTDLTGSMTVRNQRGKLVE